MHFHFASGKNQTYINNNNNRTTINKKQPNKKTSTEKKHERNTKRVQNDKKTGINTYPNKQLDYY